MKAYISANLRTAAEILYKGINHEWWWVEDPKEFRYNPNYIILEVNLPKTALYKVVEGFVHVLQPVPPEWIKPYELEE